ncbi:protein FAM32A [Anomaloglossus baeobatrachus]|uniref:protein FAM32A n=1 Tax=Anomaloglossus baeobatrachus TaxID=238106 RepID=UPI003F50B65B
MSEYASAQNGALRLKGLGDLSAGKKKKKKDKEKSKMIDQIITNKKTEEEKKKPALDKRTPAQIAFEKMQEKRQMERILKKASKTHKQRVEDFNRHLDTLTEHYDIPKVSWTK